MINLDNIVQGLSKSGAVSGFAGGLAGTAVAGAFSGKKGKKMAKSALKVGALAAVGGLAYTAYQRYRQNNNTSQAAQWQQPIAREKFESVAQEQNAATAGLLLVRAMITAATSDGHMDGDEQARIFEETERLNLSAQEKARLFDELRRPLSLDELSQQVDSPETAIEVYAASLVAIDESRPQAQAYLSQLAQVLQLPDSLVQSVHAELNQARQAQAA